MKNLYLLLILFISTSIIHSQDIDISIFASGFSSPVELKNAGDDRLFVVEQAGRIKILNADGTTNATPFLNIDPIVSSGGERGLLGLAFHPNYASNGFFYVYYTDNGGDTQVSRFSVSANPDIADAGSEVQMLSIDQPFSNHNGGCIQFGPDNMLYIGTGDGGSGGDPGNRAQNLGTLLGKMLRLNVDIAAPYIPTDNPYVSDSSALDEIWSYGLRNPWKFSFDETTGDIWIADVGQGSREEIDQMPATDAALNYGWRCYEGNSTFDLSGCPDSSTLTFPVAQYTHGSGRCSISGGYVYRGSDYPTLDGLYFFADLCSTQIGTVNSSGTLSFAGTFSGNTWVSFGEDINKELYIVSIGGQIYRIVDNNLSVDDITNSITVSFYPNPASSTITLSSSEGLLTQYTIYNLNGAAVSSEQNINANRDTVDISGFSTGVYFIKILNDAGTKVTRKLIIK